MITESILSFMETDYALLVFSEEQDKFSCARVQPGLSAEQVGDGAMGL